MASVVTQDDVEATSRFTTTPSNSLLRRQVANAFVFFPLTILRQTSLQMDDIGRYLCYCVLFYIIS